MPLEAGTHATHQPDNWLWPSDVATWFERTQPVELDLGCGKGRFLLHRAGENPDINYLGIERQLRRVRKLDRKLARRGLNNTRLLRIEAGYALRYLLPDEAFRTIYILHPDPWPKKRHAHHRLLGPAFIDSLHRVLEPLGTLYFCTDHLPYFHRAVDCFEDDPRFAEVPALIPDESERTDFELVYRERKPIGRYACQKLEN